MRKHTINHFLALAFVAAMLAVLPGCAGTVPPGFVASERQKYTAVKPFLEMTAKDHPDFAPAITDTITAWDAKLKAAEAAK